MLISSFTSCLRLASILPVSSSTWSMLSSQVPYPNTEDRSRASSNTFCSNHRMNIAWIIEWILLESSNEYCLNYRMNFVQIIEWIFLELSNEFCSNHWMNIAKIIKWILLKLFHKCRRESNAYQGEFIEFC